MSASAHQLSAPAQQTSQEEADPERAQHAHGAFDLESEGLEGAFRRFSPYVAAIGMKLLGRDDEIDDLVQDVFLKAHRHLHKLDDPDKIKSWLGRITVNTAKNKLRKRRVKRLVGLDDYGGYLEATDPNLSPEKRALLSQLYRALDKAPVNQRMAWTLRHVQGEKLKDVADLCGCSLATAKRHIKRAEELLEKELDDE